MTAYVSIRPDHDVRLRVVCKPCDGAAPFEKYRDALAAARLHNQQEHQKENPVNEEQTEQTPEWLITMRPRWAQDGYTTKTVRASRFELSEINRHGEVTFHDGQRLVFVLDRDEFVSAEPMAGSQAAE